MKKLWSWIIAGLTVVVGALAALLKIKSQQAAAAAEDAAEAKAAAEHSEQNAEALADHQGRTDEIDGEKEERNEAITSGDADSVIDSIIADNNDRVPDDC